MDQEIRKFVIKCAIAGVSFFVTIIFTAHFVGLIIMFRAMDITDMTTAQIISTIKFRSTDMGSRIIDSMDIFLTEQADPNNNNLPPEKKERMQKNLKIVWEKWRPLVQQISLP